MIPLLCGTLVSGKEGKAMAHQLPAEELIAHLGLIKHPEGGWFRESYRSEETIQRGALPDRFAGDRPAGTAIYFLLQSGDVSALHRIKSDEIWHFYSGEPLVVHVITPLGDYYPLNLGSNIPAGQSFQCTVPAGCWFGAEVAGTGFSFVGCTVAPGFDFADFEMGNRGDLLKEFPQHKEIVQRLTRSST